MCWGHGRWIVLWPLIAVLGQQGEDYHGGGADDSTQGEELQWREELNSGSIWSSCKHLAVVYKTQYSNCRIPSNCIHNENRMSTELQCSSYIARVHVILMRYVRINDITLVCNECSKISI